MYITITKHNYLPYLAVTGGTFTTNEVWYEKMNVLGNVIIANGAELEIKEGTKIKFEQDKHLTINGTLKADGTSEDPIVFTSTSGSMDWWEGIRFSSASNQSYMNCCEIEHAWFGVDLNNSDIKFDDCFIHNNDEGIHVFNSS